MTLAPWRLPSATATATPTSAATAGASTTSATPALVGIAGRSGAALHVLGDDRADRLLPGVDIAVQRFQRFAGVSVGIQMIVVIFGVIAVIAQLIRPIRPIAKGVQVGGIVEDVIFIAVCHSVGDGGARRLDASILIPAASPTTAATTTTPPPRFRWPVAQGRQAQILASSRFFNRIQIFFGLRLIVVRRVQVVDQLGLHHIVFVVAGAIRIGTSNISSAGRVALAAVVAGGSRIGSTAASATTPASTFAIAGRFA